MSFIVASASQLCSAIPRLSRSLASAAAARPIPAVGGSNTLPPAFLHRLTIPSGSGSIAAPSDFLKAIGRACETKLSVESWDQLWRMNGPEMRKSGVAVRDRRYILWCMEKYRAGFPIQQFAHELPPKKTVRGWGPAVQNGKRIRSRRQKNK